MGSRAKAAGAFQAMKAIGIPQNKVKPVLKDLLRLFDKNWAYIEDDNYRALADAIFERDEAIESSKRKEAMCDFPIQTENEAEATEEPELPLKRLRLKHRVDQGSSFTEPAEATEEPERPLKRLRLKHTDGQGSSFNEPGSSVTRIPLITPKEEPNELPEIPLPNPSDGRRSKRNVDSEASLHSKTIANGEKVSHSEGNESEETEEPELPLKRKLRRKHPDGQGSSFNKPGSSVTKIALITPKEEPNELPETHLLNLSDGRRLKRNADSERVDRLEENESEETEEPERPLKRLRLKHRDGQGSSCNESGSSVPKIPLVTPEEEPNELSETQLLNEGNQSFPPQATPSRKKSTVPESSEWKSVASHALIKPKDEPITDDTALFVVPIAVVHADPSNEGNLLGNGCTTAEHEPSVSLSVNENEPRNEGGLEKITGQTPSLEIASLPIGDTKISLSCELEFGRPGFRTPDRETVLRLVEEKCLRSYKIQDPDFSVMNLMKDMCHGFLKSGSDSSSEPPAAINVTTNTDLSITQGMNDGDDHPEMNVENEKNSVEEVNPSLVFLKQPNVVIDIANGQENAVITAVNEVNDDGDDHPEMNVENEKNSVEEMNPSLVVLKQPNGVTDIANGQENAVITVVNEVNGDSVPHFYYMLKNAVFQNAVVKFSLANIGQKNCCSTCSGDCLSLSKPCACALESGCEFAYTPDGLVKEGFLEECVSMTRDPKEHGQFFCKECPHERAKGGDIIKPCKGHVMRKFIKECWWKCGCDLHCGNRVVQRGISSDLQVFMTPEGKGWGLRTMVDLPKGAFVCEYVGEILTNAELCDRFTKCPEGEKTSYSVLLDAGWGAKGTLKDGEALCLDAAHYGNVGRFINHRCHDSNLVEIPVEVETPDHHYYHLALFTTREVHAMEELTWDYGIDFNGQDQLIKVFRCQCGSKFCRNI